jgi:hypothetical protein
MFIIAAPGMGRHAENAPQRLEFLELGPPGRMGDDGLEPPTSCL